MKFTQSLKKNYRFRVVYRRGKSVADKYLVLYACPNNLEINRLGITVSKKVGNSVVRSRVTRLVRESYRNLEPSIKCGFDLVFIARHTASTSTYREIFNSLSYCLKKLNKLDKINKPESVNNA